MRPHELFRTIEFVGFPETNKKISGVYSIGGVYVGVSMHIRKRILEHIHLCLSNYHCNKKLQNIIQLSMHLTGDPIVVEYLSSDMNDEYMYHLLLDIPTTKQTRFYHQYSKFPI